jgi:hypothetical protein
LTSSQPRWASLALIAVAAGGLLLRLVPLLRSGGPLAMPVDYDEAVYFSASALLFKGVLPYRDFVFVHPPGLAYFLGLTSAFGANGFAAARIVATLVGAINIWLVGRIVMRAAGTSGGLVAATLYATYPDVVIVERGPYLEPVLNLACLAMALLWLAPRPRAKLAGIACGFACATKVLGGIWFVAALAAARAKSDVARFIAFGAVAGLALLAPFLFRTPHPFLEQTLSFHAWRPPDGTMGALPRLAEIANSGHVAATILAVIGLFAVRRREARFFAVAALLIVAAFLTSSTYWSQYNSHLAAAQCILAGFGAAMVLGRLRDAVGTVAAIAVAIPSLLYALPAARARAPETLDVGNSIRQLVPPNDCVFSFDPIDTLASGRLPPHGDGAPVIVDSYGAQLLAAVRHGARFPDAGAAFRSPSSQPDIRARLERCRFAVLGWRGNWQMSDDTRAWFNGHFVCVAPHAGDLCLWQRWGDSLLGLAVAPPGKTIEFDDGWFGEEGTPQQPWRWMGRRGVVALPPMEGPARLELSLEFGQVNGQNVTIELDGQTLDRFTPKSPLETRRYDVDGQHRALVLSTDSTFRPPHDPRELGIRLNRLLWIPAPGAGGAAATSSPR